MTTPQRLQRQSPEEKLAATQREAAKWAAIAADPTISPSAAAFARNLARSANAEVELRLKGLGRQQPKGNENSLTSHGPKLPPGLPSLDPLIRPAISLHVIPTDQLAHPVTALDILAAQRRRPASS